MMMGMVMMIVTAMMISKVMMVLYIDTAIDGCIIAQEQWHDNDDDIDHADDWDDIDNDGDGDDK